MYFPSSDKNVKIDFFSLCLKCIQETEKKSNIQEYPGELNAYSEVTEDVPFDHDTLPWFINVIYSDWGIPEKEKHKFGRKFGI